MRNGVGTIQSLYVFLESSAKYWTDFNDMEIERDAINLKLKSRSETRWFCRYKAVNAPVKLFCPPGLRGQRKYVCDKKGRDTRKNGDFGDYIGWGK